MDGWTLLKILLHLIEARGSRALMREKEELPLQSRLSPQCNLGKLKLEDVQFVKLHYEHIYDELQ